MTADYVYARLDGGTTLCYGVIEEDSNFAIVCNDENQDGIWCGDLEFLPTNWNQVCKYLEKNYCTSIEQMEVV